MTVYLLRHGDALRESDGAGRPLSPRGREQAEVVAETLARLGAELPVIHHSGKRRALETAEIVASRLEPRPRIEALPGLDPGDAPGIARDLIETGSGPLLLTGHLPHLARLASLLTTGDADRGIVQLPTAGLVALARGETRWQLLWMLTPALLHGLAGIRE